MLDTLAIKADTIKVVVNSDTTRTIMEQTTTAASEWNEKLLIALIVVG